MLQNRATLKQIRFHLLSELRQIYTENESDSIVRLVMEHLGYPLSVSLREPDLVPDPPLTARINAFVADIRSGLPIQYVLGQTHFCDLNIKVDKRVLIPRPETEEMVEHIKARTKEPIQKIIDLGTGSGCIALALKKHFTEADKTIDDNQVHHILEWTKMHTYYTQYFCNLLFQHTETKVSDTSIEEIKNLIFKSNETTYYLFRNLLTGAQWDLLKAIARENEMHKPTSSDIRMKYTLGASSTVSRSLDALLDKEMIYNNITSDHSSYEVYDVFLSRWLQQYNS